jgi:hypothetical protein
VSLNMRYRFLISYTAMQHRKLMAFGSTTHVNVKKSPSFFRGFYQPFPTSVLEASANIYDEQQVDSEIAIHNSKSVTGVGEVGVRIEERIV